MKLFPKDFQWGVASASYQVEGSLEADGRGDCIWDTFAPRVGKATGARGSGQYLRYREDARLLQELGIKHYRMSVAWPRIFPEGRGQVNSRGLDYYNRLVDALLECGVTPHITLYHWDLPQALQDAYGGWQSREIISDFAEYTRTVVKTLGDRVSNWITLNETGAFTFTTAYPDEYEPPHAPGIKLPVAERLQVAHHALLAHGSAVQAIRATSPQPCTISVADDCRCFTPLIATPANIAATRKAFLTETPNVIIQSSFLGGGYSDEYLRLYKNCLPTMQAGDAEIIASPIDAMGLNFYHGDFVQAADNDLGYEIIKPTLGKYPHIADRTAVTPDCIYWAFKFMNEKAPHLKLYISENGCVEFSPPDAQGFVADIERIFNTRIHLAALRNALDDGLPVTGYFHWSFLDSYEWGTYEPKIGLVRVMRNLDRVPKLGALWYKEVIAQNQIV